MLFLESVNTWILSIEIKFQSFAWMLINLVSLSKSPHLYNSRNLIFEKAFFYEDWNRNWNGELHFSVYHKLSRAKSRWRRSVETHHTSSPLKKYQKLLQNRCARCNLWNLYNTWHFYSFFYNTFTILLQYFYNTFTILLQYFYNTFTILTQYIYNTNISKYLKILWTL